jgi:uncharacterized protein YgiB involved in biofilm formation
MKSNKNGITLVLAPLLALAACGTEDVQRDVYTKMEDCIADWGKPELCQSMAEADAKQHAASVGVDHSSSVMPMMFWGPGYYGSSRAVSYEGSTYAPSGNRAMSRPYVVGSSASTAARSSAASPARGGSSSSSVSRGGLGGSAAAASSGG